MVSTSRNLLAEQLASLLPHSEEVKDALADAVAADAYVGPCPKCGKDLQLRASQKTRGMFIGCAGWPDCDVTYPLPKGKVEAVPEGVPRLRHAAGEGDGVSEQAAHRLHRPELRDEQGARRGGGRVPGVQGRRQEGEPRRAEDPRTLKRFIHCENYDECGTGYPLPQYGKLEATGEVCEHCGAPIVVVTTARGPWRLCPNFDCPGKEQDGEEKAGEKASARGRRAASTKKAPAKGARKASGKAASRKS